MKIRIYSAKFTGYHVNDSIVDPYDVDGMTMSWHVNETRDPVERKNALFTLGVNIKGRAASKKYRKVNQFFYD